MTVVVGTAGHIDHGKTTLLRALTGIDADRLPEERRRGMTIDVGFAHLTLADGRVIDFVDVPGHDRLVGNMLVGAGEIDAAMLVVAADDGPRAQTQEHLALLDALGVAPGIAVVTKIDAVAAERVDEVVAEVGRLLLGTSLGGSPIRAVSGATGKGVEELRMALAVMVAGVPTTPADTVPPALAIDRAFSVRGHGSVVTGTLRGGPLARGDILRLVPGGRPVRIREIQVRGTTVERVADGGRTALNLVGIEVEALHRGDVLTSDPAVMASHRLLARFAGPVADRTRGRVHIRTAAADATIGRSGRDALTLPDGSHAGIVRLDEPIAVRPGDRFVVRRGAGIAPIGGVVLDVDPARGVSRRRQTADRVQRLLQDPVAMVDLHGALVEGRRVRLADDVAAAAARSALDAVAEGETLQVVRSRTATAIRRAATLRRDDAARAAIGVVDRLVSDGLVARDGEHLHSPGNVSFEPRSAPGEVAAMYRLVSMLSTATPPTLAEATREAGCRSDAARTLERAGRIVILEPDLAYAAQTYRELAERALALAASGPLTPARFRDATGTSRKYVMAILEDLDRRAILARTPDGHVPGPRAGVLGSGGT